MGVVDTIQSQISSAQAQAQSALDNALELNNELKDALEDVGDVNIGYHYINGVVIDSAVNPTDKPGDLTINSILQPAFNLPTIDIVDAPAIRDPGFSDFDIQSPTITMPTKPGDSSIDVPVKPSISFPDIPSSPDFSIPEAPTLGSIVIPDMPDFPEIGEFTESMPDPIDAPATPGLVYSEGTYESDLLDAARLWVLDQIQNGGTGLDPAVSQAIFDRAAIRLVDTARDNIEKTADVFSGSGFPRPSGSLRAKQAAISVDLQNRLDDLNKDIMTEQAKLAQANSHFAIDKALQTEAMLIQHYNSVADRAYDLAKATVSLAIETYNARVAEYQSRLEAYKSAASVFEIVVRASALEVEKYKSLLDAKRTEATIQTTEVEIYKSQVDAVATLARFYETQLQGSKIEADIETSKLEAFKTEISAYSTQIQAKEAEWNAYKAAIDGESARVDIYKAQIEAYQTEITAKSKLIDADKASVDAHVSIQRLNLEAAKSDIEIYQADIEKQIKIIEAQLSSYLAKNEVYKAEIDRAKAQALVNVEAAKIDQEGHKFNATVSNERYKHQALLLTEQLKAAIAGTAQGSEAAASAAAAALSQITTIAQILGEEAI